MSVEMTRYSEPLRADPSLMNHKECSTELLPGIPTGGDYWFLEKLFTEML